MADPAKHVAGAVRYEVRLQSGPWTIRLRGALHEVPSGSAAAVLVRVTMQGRSVIDEKIVGIVGDNGPGAFEFLALIEFLNAGGVIGLHRDLVR